MSQRSKPGTDWSSTAKAIFMLVCCTAGAAFATESQNPRQSNIYKEGQFILPWLPALLLCTTLMVSLWTGIGRGKRDASWAILTWGSWLTIPCSLFYYVVSAEAKRGLPFDSIHVVGCITLIVLFVGGFKAAWQAKWNDVSTWWLGSILLTAILYFSWQGL